MIISKTMVRNHLARVTVDYFTQHDTHPNNPDEYATYIDNIKKSAEKSGDLKWLKLAIEYVLTHPEEDASQLNAGTYAFNNDRMRSLLETIWATLWPESEVPVAPSFEEMSDAKWEKLKTKGIYDPAL